MNGDVTQLFFNLALDGDRHLHTTYASVPYPCGN